MHTYVHLFTIRARIPSCVYIGLAMRYHLHEVLDIGDRYDWKVLNWEVREIEKPGSWHTTVG